MASQDTNASLFMFTFGPDILQDGIWVVQSFPYRMFYVNITHCGALVFEILKLNLK